MILKIRKRDGTIDEFMPEKITRAIFKAARACGGEDYSKAECLCEQVIDILQTDFKDKVPHVEEVQDIVEKVLIENGHAKTAKAYILYREKRTASRESNALIGATIKMFSDYLGDMDWLIKENANTQKSINGLNNYVREIFTKNYWLHEVYPDSVRKVHESGDAHIHDLGFFGPYCAGWDLRQLLMEGFGGVEGKVESKPAKHLRAFWGQVVNSTFTTQGETAGAQAWSGFDTFSAPFIYYDNLNFAQVKQAIQEFVFNINVPTRVGFQCPFSNLTFDIKCPKNVEKEPVIIGGKYMDKTYGDFQKEMDMINMAFCEVMLEGDAKGRVFTFPIPTINVTNDLEWNSPVVEAYMKITAKYGIPYFANYINSTLSPEDALSMCCRLRIDTSELRKRGGGLFGSNPLTGSIGVYTINLPRIGYVSNSVDEFKHRLRELAEIGKESLEIKRKIIERETEKGLYPYSARYLKSIKQRFGEYWYNHFNTIGVVGMNEAMLNLIGKDITTTEGQEASIDIMNYLREIMTEFQEETGHFYNLEATPGEGTSYRLAKLDKQKYPDIITAGKDIPYYTNSTQLPVEYTDDIFETIDLQDELQSLYTGGTVLHLYLGESVPEPKIAANLIRKVFEKYKLPYISITPTFSICKNHGYLKGEQEVCGECGEGTEIWSRVVGYLRPINNYNEGKQEEYANRKKYVIKEEAI
ncbi:MAG: ribonucleoside triphosphate reductase [Deltaproteobacteria bacterium]